MIGDFVVAVLDGCWRDLSHRAFMVPPLCFFLQHLKSFQLPQTLRPAQFPFLPLLGSRLGNNLVITINLFKMCYLSWGWVGSRHKSNYQFNVSLHIWPLKAKSLQEIFGRNCLKSPDLFRLEGGVCFWGLKPSKITFWWVKNIGVRLSKKISIPLPISEAWSLSRRLQHPLALTFPSHNHDMIQRQGFSFSK